MPRRKNPLLRTLVPLAAMLIGTGVIVAVATNSANQNRSAQAAPQTATQSAPQAASHPDHPGDTDWPRFTDSDTQAPVTPPAAPGADAPPPAEQSAAPPVATEGVSPSPPTQPTAQLATQAAPPAGALRARVVDDAPPAPPIGSLDGIDGHLLSLAFSRYGAGIASLQLGQGYFETIGSSDHVRIQGEQAVARPGQPDLTAVPFAALLLGVDGVPGYINIASPGIWTPIPGSPGAFQAIIETEAGEPVLRLERRFELIPASYRVTLTRSTFNLTDRPLTVRWTETGPIDLPEPESRYGGDKRRVRFGYLLPDRMQAGSDAVTADHDLRGRVKILGDRETDASGYKRYRSEAPIWPTPVSLDKGHRLVWAAFSSRYFAVAMHPIFDPDAVQPGGELKLFREVEQIDRLVLNPYIADPQDAVMVARVTAAPERIAPGGVSAVSIGIYAGPLLEAALKGDDLTRALNLQGLIVYNFGGFCGTLCTFGWMTHILLWVLRAAHTLTLDWAAAIIILVLIVRTVLHPITRWSQIRLQRFGKQMQAMAPKQQKLREKFKDDPKRMQEEMARLWKEEGVNPAGALGCLPMFLQSPVWIALYATLYFAAELRHQPAFWGVFQSISGGNWLFLADLSSPDAALPLPAFMHFTPPLLGSLYGRVESINLLPVLMAVLFWAHQKYLSPPPSASMSPEMEQQQKIMKIMFPIMIPLFMYPAPSGLLIYFITNSALGIIENKHIRSSAEKQGLLDLDKIKAEKAAKRSAGKGGFFSRLQELAEQQQQLRAQQGGAPSKRVQNVAKPEPRPRNYKKRK